MHLPVAPIPTPAVPASADPYIGSVKSLLHFDDVDGTTIPVDSIPVVTWTNALPLYNLVSSAQRVFASGNSLFHFGESVSHAGYGLRTSFTGLTGKIFTIDIRFRFSLLGNNALYGQGEFVNRFCTIQTADSSNRVTINANGTSGLMYLDGGGSLIATSATIVVNTWYALAVVYDGTNILIFLDGVLVLSQVYGLNITGAVDWTPVNCFWGNGAFGKLFVDEARLTWGIARYSAASPPTVATSPFPSAVTTGSQIPSYGPPRSAVPFSAIVLPSIYGVVGTALGTLTLATLTCSDQSATAVYSSSFAGLTPVLTWLGGTAGTLTISGTPSGAPIKTTLTVTYISSDGTRTALGTTTHVVTIVDPAKVLTLGTMASVTGQVGRTLAATTLETLTSNFAVDVVAIPANSVPGYTVSLAWTRAASSGSGTLSISGIPTEAGVTSLVVNYYGNGILLGTSTHTITVAEAYVAPPPAPAPAPAPPYAAVDPFFSSVKVLTHCDSPTSYFDVHNLIGAYNDSYFSSNYLNLVSGATGQGIEFTVPGGSLYASSMLPRISGIDGSSGNLGAECFVNISTTAWTALSAAGAEDRYCPVMTLLSASGETIWSVGFFSAVLVNSAGVTYRQVMTAILARQISAATGVAFVFQIGSYVAFRPGRFVHLAVAWQSVGSAFRSGTWFDGKAGINNYFSNSISSLQIVPVGSLMIGGLLSDIAGLTIYKAPSTQQVAFSGIFDECRIGNVNRYAAYMAGADLPASVIALPWPNS